MHKYTAEEFRPIERDAFTAEFLADWATEMFGELSPRLTPLEVLSGWAWNLVDDLHDSAYDKDSPHWSAIEEAAKVFEANNDRHEARNLRDALGVC